MNLIVTSENGANWLDWGQGKRRCAVGKGGIGIKSGEGDGMTPRGLWPIREVLWRPDRIEKPETILPLRAIEPNDGWCDAPNDPHYNELVKLPYAASHEELWRFDHVYDLIAVIGYNDAPMVAGKGSAIFLHLAQPNFGPTAGCVALTLGDALAALKQINLGDQLQVV